MKLLKRFGCLFPCRGGNVKSQTALGESPESELSDRGSTPLISTTCAMRRLLFAAYGISFGAGKNSQKIYI